MSKANLQSAEYQKWELDGKVKGQDWATDTRAKAFITVDHHEDDPNITMCLLDTKTSHYIPQSYKHTIATDPEQWMILMKVKMDMLKKKHTWDLVKPPPGANIMDSIWVYDIKWDGERNRIKDKAQLVGKGYTQQLRIDYNKT